ncbi:MAG: DNA mismatch repair endonuclease MutL [Candidatus Amulumruptor caecigallinarius]|nr:DNA mismatch repair endonuclease MutL [Candidatus Amulumruptor caecigallinarius]MCM1396716.1 DNA mismatch repair endonuclease MutL [Candidatus Amulumruptor caecigallinarius]MCM1453226.1 DNA mismatch repair endonuclease MutL [bacterium]
MSDVIHLLPDSVANQIAAGEVIQQPASVVKELVENAVDAGAKHITIVIKDAGRTLIQVVDDGCGMSDTDARLAFERHATSKIRAAADLFTLHTMGFRGEALASICAVAQVELRTRREADAVGTRLEISGSRVTAQEPCGCPAGSNLSVKNLFFNVPARRKFLKKDSVEFSAVVKEFERLALVNPEVDLTLIHNDVTVHRLAKTSVKQRITDLFGKTLGSQLIPVETDTSIVTIKGYIGLPETARKKGALQFLTVNGRNMRHPVFQKAVMQCYDNLIAHDAKPNFFIDFKVDPDSIDVNIHPTKNEIKFENEMAIRQILVAAVRESMGKYNVVPAIDFESNDVPDIPAFNPDSEAEHSVDVDINYNPFDTSASSCHPASEGGTQLVSGDFSGRPRTGGYAGSRLNGGASVTGWEALYDNFRRGEGSTAGMRASALNGSDDLPDADTPQSASGGFDMLPDNLSDSAVAPAEITGFDAGETAVPGAFQVKGRYIVTLSHDGIMVVDQHRAHVNVLYHDHLRRLSNSDIPSQTLLFPERVELSPAQTSVIDSVLPDLRHAGFDMAPADDGAWQVTAVPAPLADSNVAAAVLSLIEEITDTDSTGAEGLRSAIAMGMARAGAIRHGHRLSLMEMEHLLADLFRLPTPALLPDGRKVLATLPADLLADLLA